MGRNFHWKVVAMDLPTGEQPPIALESPIVHIGKASSAGPYCWRCRLTMHKDGWETWYTACPCCGDQEEVDLLMPLSPPVQRQSGVTPVCSFEWAQAPEVVQRLCQLYPQETLIEDEEGKLWTGEAFLRYLEQSCPIWYLDHVGESFL